MPVPIDVLLAAADALSADLGAAFPTVEIGAEAVAVVAERADDWLFELSDAALQSPSIRVIDGGELLETEGGGMAAETLELWVVVQMKPAAGLDKGDVVEGLAGLAAAIGRRLRPLDGVFCLAVGDERLHCTRIERKPARDLDEWHQNGLFHCRLVTTWKRY